MNINKVITEISPEQLYALGFASTFSSDPQNIPASKSFKLNSLELIMPDENINRFYYEGVELFEIMTLRELNLLMNIK